MDKAISEKVVAVDLEIDGHFLLQNKNGYKISSDAVLLANFVECDSSSMYLDMCSGSGIVGVLVSLKKHPKHTFLVEVQEVMAKLCKLSLKENNLTSDITLINDDIKNYNKYFENGSFDVISVNPPYYKKNSGKLSDNQENNIARHELLIELKDVIKIASKLLKKNGMFYMVYPETRLEEVMLLLNDYDFKPIKLVLNANNSKSKDNKVFLISAKKLK